MTLERRGATTVGAPAPASRSHGERGEQEIPASAPRYERRMRRHPWPRQSQLSRLKTRWRGAHTRGQRNRGGQAVALHVVVAVLSRPGSAKATARCCPLSSGDSSSLEARR
jgi:hypothetical protein